MNKTKSPLKHEEGKPKAHGGGFGPQNEANWHKANLENKVEEDGVEEKVVNEEVKVKEVEEEKKEVKVEEENKEVKVEEDDSEVGSTFTNETGAEYTKKENGWS